MAAERPDTGLSLSVAMIVRNEADCLPSALKSVAGVASEIIVVDTGSADDTVSIAQAHGARLIQSPWQEDFSQARNVSLEAATGDWILCLDADETLAPGQESRLRRLLSGRADAFYVQIRSPLAGTQSGQTFVHAFQRLFRNRKEYRFQGRVHEQVFPSLSAHGARIEFSNLVIHHSGYHAGGKIQRAKLERNLRLLLRDLEDRPADPLLHFFLGETYALLGEPLQASERYEHALHTGGLPPGHDAAAYQNWGSALLRLGRWAEAVERANRALEIHPGMTTALLVKASAECRMGRHEAAVKTIGQYLKKSAIRAGSEVLLSFEPDHARAYLIRGECRLRLGQLSQAQADATQVVRERADWAAGHRLMARVLAAGGSLATSEDHLRQAVDLDPAHVRTRRDLAMIQSERGLMDRALETISTGIEHSEQKDLYACQGWLRIKKGDLHGAVESYRNLLRLDPDCEEAHRRLAGLYHKTGKSEQALAHLTKIETGR
jgi:tetratricopeptide (TPR) repeat protein